MVKYGATPTTLGLKNCPNDNTGTLTVDVIGVVINQKWNDVNGNIYYRAKYKSYADFSSWKRIC